MDLLKAEINRKRKISEDVENAGGSIDDFKTKALRQDAILSHEEQKYLESRSNNLHINNDDDGQVLKSSPIEANRDILQIYTGRPKDDSGICSEKQQYWSEVNSCTSQEVKLRLRCLGEAVALFGERDAERKERLVATMMRQSTSKEADNERLNIKAVKKGASVEDKHYTTTESEDRKETRGKIETGEDIGVCTNYSNDLERMGPEKVIYKYFKNLIHNWETDLSQRSASESNSAKGRKDKDSFQSAKESIKALFKLCKQKEVPLDIRDQLLEMVKSCEAGNFRQAHDHYLQAAIGNAAWPIGVTSVGIHERSNRERLSESKIAHVMNNEMQRKYFTAVKRLMTYAQSKRPDVAPSMKVL